MELPKIKFIFETGNKRSTKKHKSNLKRPLTLKLIIAYCMLQLLFVILSIVAGYGGYIGFGAVLLVAGLYYGLWKMEREWMWVVVFILGVTTALYMIYAADGLNIIGVMIIILNVLSMHWLYTHKNIFSEPVKKKNNWLKIVVIIFAAIIILIIIGGILSVWFTSLTV